MGIPTVLDHFIQQAIARIVQHEWEPDSHPRSYGFRPGSSAHGAVAYAQVHIRKGYGWVVDIDLDAFFDWGNLDRSMVGLRYHCTDGPLIPESKRPAAPPLLTLTISYELDGEQYVAAATGFGSSLHLTSSALLPRTGAAVPGGLFVWKLDGVARMPTAESRPTLAPPPGRGSEAEVGHGGMLYARYCMQCHGAGAMAGGGMPDLLRSAYLAEVELFRRPLLDGLLAQRGMPTFSDTFRAAAADAIRAYVGRMAHTFRTEMPAY